MWQCCTNGPNASAPNQRGDDSDNNNDVEVTVNNDSDDEDENERNINERSPPLAITAMPSQDNQLMQQQMVQRQMMNSNIPMNYHVAQPAYFEQPYEIRLIQIPNHGYRPMLQ